MVISQKKGLLSTKHIREKGRFYTYNLREKVTSRTFLDKHAYIFNQEWPRRETIITIAVISISFTLVSKKWSALTLVMFVEGFPFLRLYQDMAV